MAPGLGPEPSRLKRISPTELVIPVTRPFLPPLDEYMTLVEGIWSRGQLTNNGPLVQELEARLAEYFGVRHAFFVSNGTIAIQIAIKALDLTGEIITTPFSYVATSSSIAWEGCRPVFADVDPNTLTIDPAKVEQVVGPQTRAILATHVYGIPCDTEALAAVARAHGLAVIYDAAHAFGTRYNGRALPAYGDISTLSFHATKLFHTVEGGAVLTEDDRIAARIAYMRNFGHNGQEEFFGVGINGKNSEMHAAMGLCMLPRIERLIAERAAIHRHYDTAFAGIAAISRPRLPAGTEYNHSYYPILLPSEAHLLAVRDALHANGITPRRYFFPSLNQLPYVDQVTMPVAEDAARRVLCLPLYSGLAHDDVDRIAGIIVGRLPT